MPNPRLCCAGSQRERPPAAVNQHSRGGPHFNGVSQGGAGAVHLQVGDVSCRQASKCQAGPHHLLLAGPVGRRQAAAAPILVHRTSAEQRQCAVLACSARRLQQQGSDCLAAHIAVGRGIQRLAAAVCRQHARLVEHGCKQAKSNRERTVRCSRKRIRRLHYSYQDGACHLQNEPPGHPPVVSGDSSRPAPAVRPATVTPLKMLPAAMCEATREEEQAVSTLTAGPLKAKV